MDKNTKCPDCQVDPGERHIYGCDTAQCRESGIQFLSCGWWLDDGDEPEHECAPTIWTGEWPGVVQCQELGWYTSNIVGVDGPTEDLNRLYSEGQSYGWDSKKERWNIPPEKAVGWTNL